MFYSRETVCSPVNHFCFLCFVFLLGLVSCSDRQAERLEHVSGLALLSTSPLLSCPTALAVALCIQGQAPPRWGQKAEARLLYRKAVQSAYTEKVDLSFSEEPMAKPVRLRSHWLTLKTRERSTGAHHMNQQKY